jgi:hypothetical protein
MEAEWRLRVITDLKVFANILCFWPLTASTTSEVKNDHAHVITQEICNKCIEIKFSVGCMVLGMAIPRRISLLEEWRNRGMAI